MFSIFKSCLGYKLFASLMILFLSLSQISALPSQPAAKNILPTTTGFLDVPSDYWAVSFITHLYSAGITSGCSLTPLLFCPEQNVTRAQMAVFLERSVHGNTFSPPLVPVTFADTVGNWAQYWIEALYADGITNGCGASNYCPEAFVTRAQMAVFLLRAWHGKAYLPPAATGAKFTDVPAGYWASAWVEQLANEGITVGCAPQQFCPEGYVTRAQMAVFLVRTFNFDILAPAAISDLSATAGQDAGTVELAWTAPGDDGATGTPSTYLVRYSASAIDTETAWDNATPVLSGLPVPQPAGSPESLIIQGLTPEQPWYFAVRASDEAQHVGGLSNSATATATAPGPLQVDLVLLIDNSTTMALNSQGSDADPTGCNSPAPGLPGNCHPFEEIKTAAKLLVNQLSLSPDGLVPGIDRVSVVTFARFPKIELEMTDNKQTIMTAIDNLTVYPGEYKCPWAFDNGLSYYQWLPIWLAENPANTMAGREGPCRLHMGGTFNPVSGLLNPDGAYITLYSWEMYASEDTASPNPRNWMTTNTGGGLKVAGNILRGQYPSGWHCMDTSTDIENCVPYIPNPVSRANARKVVVLLSDGYANAGYSADGNYVRKVYDPASQADRWIQTSGDAGTQFCPQYTWRPITGYSNIRWCVDQDARPTVADLLATPPPGAEIFSHRHSFDDPRNLNPATAVYDADDYARDMLDFVTNSPDNPTMPGPGALLFSIGFGSRISQRSTYELNNNLPAPGTTLLQYGAYKGNGVYYAAPGTNDLEAIILDITGRIANLMP